MANGGLFRPLISYKCLLVNCVLFNCLLVNCLRAMNGLRPLSCAYLKLMVLAIQKRNVRRQVRTIFGEMQIEIGMRLCTGSAAHWSTLRGSLVGEEESVVCVSKPAVEGSRNGKGELTSNRPSYMSHPPERASCWPRLCRRQASPN